MKSVFLYALGLSTILMACLSQKKPEADFPTAMLPDVKEEYAKRFEKGRILYELNCAACHTTKKGRKKVVPDFKPEQLRGYALRVANAEHESQMPDSLVSEEDLGIIMTFLSYKKKNVTP